MRLVQRAWVELGHAQERAWRLLRHLLPTESQHLFALTIVVGLVCGLIAVAFHLSIKAAEALLIERALHASGDGWIAWTILSPTLGGLAAGAALFWLVPGARGSGIPQVKAAFALEDGRVRFRDAFGKFWLSTLQIGAGASLGREGPTVQICAGATSLLARLTGLPARSSRRLIPVGVAAGIAAAFNAPIAAVTFTIEEIVGRLDHAVLSGVVVAAALAAVIERQVLGVHPVIEAPQAYGLDHASSLFFFAFLGMAGAAVSVLFTDGLLKLRLAFRGLRWLPTWAHPGVGGLVTGVLAVVVMQTLSATGVTGGGYAELSRALAGQLPLRLLLVLGAVKLVATVFSYSSGGAGGIFAPSLFVGAMVGGVIGHLDVIALGHEPRQLGAFALVGMGAVFAGVIRAPITSVLIIFEMTGGYGLVLPLMLANMTSYLLARHLRPTPIYEALLKQDGITLPHDEPARPHPFDLVTVGEAMTSPVVTAGAEATVAEALPAVQSATFALVPVLDRQGRLAGAVSVSALRQAAPETPLHRLAQPVETVRSDAPLTLAAVRMNDQRRRQLVVLDRGTQTVVGMLTITDLVRAHASARPGLGGARAEDTTDGLGDRTAVDVARGVPTVAPSLRLKEALETLAHAPVGAVLVAEQGQPPVGVILFEHVRDFVADDGLQQMLRVSDLSRPVELVEAATPFSTLAQRFASSPVEALVLDEPEHRVVLRSAVGGALIKWLADRQHERA